MTMFNTPEFKVGLLVILVAGVIAVMSLRVSEDPSYLGTARAAYFIVDDATGLVEKSPAYMAGIRVGVIDSITLLNGKARVQIALRPDVPLTTTSRIEIKASGILGDKIVSIIPGNPEDPPLGNGERIYVVDDQASIERLISEVTKITKSIADVAENIKQATEGNPSQPLGRIVRNLETLSEDLAAVSSGNREKLNEIVDQVHTVTSTLSDFVGDESDDGFKAAWRDAVASLQKIEKTISNMEEISDKVNRGEGTIGRLINDETTVEQLNTAITGVNEFLGSANRLETSLDFHSYYLSDADQFKSFIGIKIQPGLDRYYLIQVVDDPAGLPIRETTTRSVDGGPETVTEERTVHRDRVKFTALFAKNIYDFTLRGGMIETSGGVGIDYHFLRRKARFSIDAFNFEDFKLRPSLRFDLFYGLYLVGGVHNLAAKDGEDMNSFIGAGLFLTNDDLKTFLSAVSF